MIPTVQHRASPPLQRKLIVLAYGLHSEYDTDQRFGAVGTIDGWLTTCIHRLEPRRHDTVA